MTSIPSFDVRAYLDRAEGPHFDRKSLFEGAPEQKRARKRRAVRDQVAEYCAGFANAEGGVLLLGIEDDGTITGHGLPADAVRAILGVPADRLDPPQPPGFTVQVEGHELIAFDVPMAAVPVMVVGDGYPLRMGEQTIQASYDQVQALKFRGLMQSFEAQPSVLTVDDLNPELLARAQAGAGLGHLSVAEYLEQRRLADRRGRTLVLRQAAELLFHGGLPEHPNAGVRVFRVVGRERLTGLEHNVEELPRIEGALPRVLDETFATVTRLLRRPSRLTVGGRFQQTWEYPAFSWKEAVLNAVAHRDYAVAGRGVEVWLFDDRFEVTNPGGLVESVSLEQLLRLKRVHVSRNPRLVRGLVDLGFMRDQGEGIPRMFWEMEGEFLPPPELQVDAHEVRLTLRNTMTLSPSDRAFIESLQGEELSAIELRALLHTHRAGQVDNAHMRAATGLDTLAASQVLQKLRNRQLLELHPAGGASYYTLAPRADRGELGADRGELGADRGELGADREELGVDRGEPRFTTPESQELAGESRKLTGESNELAGESNELAGESNELAGESNELAGESNELAGESNELDKAHAVPRALHDAIARLGSRPSARQLRRLILKLCQTAPRDTATLAAILGRNPEALARHIRAMVGEGTLRPRFPDILTHPQQAYLAAQPGLLDDGDDD